MRNKVIARRIVTMLMIAVMLISTQIVQAFAVAGDIKVYVNENKITFPDAKPFINNDNRTLVPIRSVAEALGADVTWEGDTRTVIIEKDKRITLKIGESRAYVNQKEKKFDTKSIIKKERTFVPLRFVSETLGAKVEWNGKNRTVLITTSKEIDKTEKEEEYKILNGYKIPKEIVETDDYWLKYLLDDSDVVDYSGSVSVADPKRLEHFEIIKSILESKFDSDADKAIISEMIEYAKTKTSTDQELPDKVWNLSTGQEIGAYSLSGDPGINMGVGKLD